MLLLVCAGLLLISALDRDKIIIMVELPSFSHFLAIVISLICVRGSVHLLILSEF